MDALEEAIQRSAAPTASRLALGRLVVARPDAAKLLADDPDAAAAAVAVTGASRKLSRVVETHPDAVSSLAALDRRPPVTGATVEELVRSKDLEELRIAARDLLDLDPVEDRRCHLGAGHGRRRGALRLVGAGGPPLAVIGMGKLGGGELNYASDIDVMFVGEGDPAQLERIARRLVEVVRAGVPRRRQPAPPGPASGRSSARSPRYRGLLGSVGRTVGVPGAAQGPIAVAGDAELGAAFDDAAEPTAVVAGLHRRRPAGDAPPQGPQRGRARPPGPHRPRGQAGPGRHPRHRVRRPDAAARPRPTRSRSALADDARRPGRARAARATSTRTTPGSWPRRTASCAASSTVCSCGRHPGARDARRRRRAHRDRPHARAPRRRGRPAPSSSSTPQLARAPGHGAGDPRAAVLPPAARGVLRERRGAAPPPRRRRGAGSAPSASPTDSRTRAAVRELTRGFTRSSRLMQQILPLLLGWLSESPDPDLGLLNLRNLFDDPRRSAALTRAFRESPEAATPAVPPGRDEPTRRRHPRTATPTSSPASPTRNGCATRERDDARRFGGTRARVARRAATSGSGPLRRWKDRHLLGVIARDVLHGAPSARSGPASTAIAEASLEAALDAVGPTLPLAVIALGRFGGAELSYASDLDVRVRLRRFDGRRLRRGDPPGHGPAPVRGRRDTGRANLERRPRPAARGQARVRWPARSRGTPPTSSRWAHVWERQAMLRARPVAGDDDVARRFMDLLEEFVWRAGTVRRRRARDPPDQGAHRARADPARRGPCVPPQARPRLAVRRRVDGAAACSWTRGIRSPSTTGALDAPRRRRCPRCSDADVLATAYRFCESHQEPALPRRQRPRSTPCQRTGRRLCCGWPARWTPPLSAARGLPASHPPRPSSRRAPVLRPVTQLPARRGL